MTPSSKPLSLKQICVLERGYLSGAYRATLTRDLESALTKLFAGLAEEHGPEDAAAVLWAIVSRDGEYVPADWLLAAFRESLAWPETDDEPVAHALPVDRRPRLMGERLFERVLRGERR